MHGKSPPITTDPNTVQNWSKICKLIDLVIRIELTRTILMPRFSNFLRNFIIHFRMILYLETCFLRVTVSLLCRLQAVSKTHVDIYPYLISEGRRNCSSCNRHSNAWLRKHVTKYKNMRKWMAEFLDHPSAEPFIQLFYSIFLKGAENRKKIFDNHYKVYWVQCMLTNV